MTLHHQATLSPSSITEQLPGSFYIDDDIFKQEMKFIFQSTWQLVGREENIPHPGDYLTTTLGQEPIVIFRDEENKLRAYYNVCPHRGARMLQGKGNCKTIICPYHAWTFDCRGQLLHIPQQTNFFPDVNTNDIQLFAAAVDSWRGFIFVNPTPNAPPLLDYLADFPDFLNQYEESYEELKEVVTYVFDEPVNWKILVENYVEDYHFGMVHPVTLKAFDFQKVETLPTGLHCRVYMPYRNQAPKTPSKYPWEAAGASYQGYIFPSMMIQTAKNHVSIFRVIPISSQRTLIEIPIYQTPAQREKYPLDLEVLKADVHRDMEEDFVICRLLQANVQSRHYRISALANQHELGISHFHKTWRSCMPATLHTDLHKHRREYAHET